MSIVELLVIAVGLSMDAFSVSVCKGLSVSKVKIQHVLLCGIFFGFFQGAMPFIGYYLGITFSSYIQALDHWIAFVLLSYIGINMFREAKEDSCDFNPDFSFKTMFLLAIATSIDALTIGVSFAFLKVEIISSCLIIGITTFVFSAVGVLIGHMVGCRFSAKAQKFGGIILVLLGVKILIEHLFF
ncbi:MAG: manganese efflux pump MntP family protein [Erysipelotrichaceae bacterium]